MGNFIQHMGKWRATTPYAANKQWGWRVFPQVDIFHDAAWTDSPAFYDSLFSNATDWGLVTCKHDHVAEQMPTTPPAMEELGYTGRVLDAELAGLQNHGVLPRRYSLLFLSATSVFVVDVY